MEIMGKGKVRITTSPHGAPLEIQIEGKKVARVGKVEVTHYDWNQCSLFDNVVISLVGFESLEIVEQEKEVK